MGKLENKVAIVTGSAGGICFETAKKFVQEGAKVVMTDMNRELLEKSAGALRAMGGQVLAVEHDVICARGWKNVFAKTQAQHGKVNILVNGAGILSRKSIQEETVDMLKKAFDVMVCGMFMGTQQAIEAMERNGEPCAILNIASVVGTFVDTKSNIAYNTVKAAVTGLTKAAAVDLAGTNIRINAVHPGTILTPMTAGKLETDTAYKAAKVAKIPLGRVALPEEVAAPICFLCSDEASYIHGASLVIDGGQILGFVAGLSETIDKKEN